MKQMKQLKQLKQLKQIKQLKQMKHSPNRPFYVSSIMHTNLINYAWKMSNHYWNLIAKSKCASGPNFNSNDPYFKKSLIMYNLINYAWNQISYLEHSLKVKSKSDEPNSRYTGNSAFWDQFGPK